MAPGSGAERPAGAAADAVHPVVICHPDTGRKALYLDPGFTVRFDGWTEEESLPLLVSYTATRSGPSSPAASSGGNAPSPSGTIARPGISPLKIITANAVSHLTPEQHISLDERESASLSMHGEGASNQGFHNLLLLELWRDDQFY